MDLRGRVAAIHGVGRDGRHVQRFVPCGLSGSGWKFPPGNERRQRDRPDHDPGNRRLAELDDGHKDGDVVGRHAVRKARDGFGWTGQRRRQHQHRAIHRGVGADAVRWHAHPAAGTVQAENFDNGGEGVAYHDESSRQQRRRLSIHRCRYRNDRRRLRRGLGRLRRVAELQRVGCLGRTLHDQFPRRLLRSGRDVPSSR